MGVAVGLPYMRVLTVEGSQGMGRDDDEANWVANWRRDNDGLGVRVSDDVYTG